MQGYGDEHGHLTERFGMHARSARKRTSTTITTAAKKTRTSWPHSPGLLLFPHPGLVLPSGAIFIPAVDAAVAVSLRCGFFWTLGNPRTQLSLSG